MELDAIPILSERLERDSRWMFQNILRSKDELL